ncbi:Lipopolysaccharide assembly protein A [Tepidimonas fonticaldi]|uniref:Lipopolysaccharide assembly protein A n=1 Tax=Tepidimonas fonticaldi TaxID=1101373 RepID=A0A554XFX8_9BURK|nr:lipopolysaccharide assembly protein LapA domain-containing protein [Tepidimonas fonticaldi]TSE34743.1 Lipopolysaccharide assembly protein A [Tepidimonas fonticaldi]
MRVLGWLLKAAVFLLIFALAINNQAPVRVHGLFGAQWEAPLVLVLLLVLFAGVLLGMAVMAPLWWRARRTARQSSTATPPTTPASSTAAPALEEPPHGV